MSRTSHTRQTQRSTLVAQMELMKKAGDTDEPILSSTVLMSLTPLISDIAVNLASIADSLDALVSIEKRRK